MFEESDKAKQPSQGETGPLPPGITPELQAGLNIDQLETFREIRRRGAEISDRVERRSAGLLMPREQDGMAGVLDPALAYVRVARAVRQIAVLEREIVGLREPPRRRLAAFPGDSSPGPAQSRDLGRASAFVRSDLNDPSDLDDAEGFDDPDDLDDYDTRPAGLVAESVRDALDEVDLAFPEDPSEYLLVPAAAANPEAIARTQARCDAALARHALLMAKRARPRGRGPPRQ